MGIEGGKMIEYAWIRFREVVLRRLGEDGDYSAMMSIL
jgi:hypothetical protein